MADGTPTNVEARSPLAVSLSAGDDLGTPRQWLVLLIISLNYGLNAVIYMNTCAAETAFTETFRLDPGDSRVAQLFAVFLITAVVGMTPGMFWGIKSEGSAVGFSIAMNVCSAWLRYASVVLESYELCLVSTIVNGIGAWTILCLPAQVSQQRFHPSQWTLTTSMIVQANYAGWLLGALIPAHTMFDPASVKSSCFVQALATTPVPILFLAFYRPVSDDKAQRAAESRAEHSICSNSVASAGVDDEDTRGGAMGEGSFCQLFSVCMRYPLFVVQVVAYGLIGGVSFAQPSATAAIMTSYGFEDSLSGWITVCFIGAGVISGLILGKECSEPLHFGVVLKALFVAAAVSTVLSAILCHIGYVDADNTASFVVFMLLSAVAGATTLGFIGIAIEAAALYPVGAGYACWVVQFITYAVGGSLGFVVCNADGFITLGSISTVAAVLVLLSYRYFADETQ